MARADVTPRQSQGAARMSDMVETTITVRGLPFAAVMWAAVKARVAMSVLEGAPADERLAAARAFLEGVRETAQVLNLQPGQLAEALRHARVVYREGFSR